MIIVLTYTLAKLIGLTLSLRIKYDFSPSNREITNLGMNFLINIVIITILVLFFSRTNFFNGAIREFLKVTGLTIKDLEVYSRYPENFYKIKKGKVFVKRKYQRDVINELENKLKEEEYRKISFNYYGYKNEEG